MPLMHARTLFSIPARLSRSLEKHVMLATLLAAVLTLAPSPGVAGDTHRPLLDTFKARYAHLMQAVKAGKLPSEVGTKADALWLSLRKDLINVDARMDMVKLDAKEYHGDQQDAALNRLIDTAADRERILIHAFEELGELMGNEACVAEAFPVSPKQQVADNGPKSPAGRPPQTVEFDFSPEDLTKTQME